MRLDSYKGPRETDSRLSSIQTPLNVAAWQSKLQHHPDKDFVKYILHGIEHGFGIGLNTLASFESAKNNMPSAKKNPTVIDTYLQEEIAKGNFLGPYTQANAPSIHINRIGAIQKKHQPGKWRVITDLSFPQTKSVNDAISISLCSLTYITVDRVARDAIALGQGSLLAKIDIKAAYRLVPIWPADRRWLGVKWREHIYIDTKLPFGLRSAPKIFTALADALEWCVAKEGVEHIYHYLDDFIVVGPPDSEACLCYLETLKTVCRELGVPLASEKQDGPTPVIVFLGIVIDTVKQEMRLPEDKLQRLLSTLQEWEDKKDCFRKEVESLVGVLQHACKVIRPGRSFLRHAISLLSRPKNPNHYTRLNKNFRSDMMWWKLFAHSWNGSALIVHPGSRKLEMTSDASGSWGCGAWFNDQWFQLQWNQSSYGLHIAVKELIPILIGTFVWGEHWKGARVTAYCDNTAVVSVLNSRYTADDRMMQMLRCLFFVEAHFQFQLHAVHIPGRHNNLADYLSRNRLHTFLSEKHSAAPKPSHVPSSLLQWLLHMIPTGHLPPGCSSSVLLFKRISRLYA